jgi:hypothetical protein
VNQYKVFDESVDKISNDVQIFYTRIDSSSFFRIGMNDINFKYDLCSIIKHLIREKVFTPHNRIGSLEYYGGGRPVETGALGECLTFDRDST